MISSELLEKLKEATRSSIKALDDPRLRDEGMILSDMLFNEDSNIWMGLHWDELNTDSSHLHGHDYFELTYVLSGTARQRINSNDHIDISRGSLCIMNPKAKHCLYVPGEEDLVLNIGLRIPFFNASFFSLIGGHGHLGAFFYNFLSAKETEDYLMFHFEASEDTDHMISDMISVYLGSPEYSNVILRCLLTLLFTSVMSENNRVLSSDMPNNNKIQRQVTSLLDYLSDHYAEATLRSTAEHFHYHPNYLSRFVKEHTGRNFKEILNEIKAGQCTYLLLNTNLSISEISDQLGFSQLCNFYDFMYRNFNTTPTNYRKLNRSR